MKRPPRLNEIVATAAMMNVNAHLDPSDRRKLTDVIRALAVRDLDEDGAATISASAFQLEVIKVFGAQDASKLIALASYIGNRYRERGGPIVYVGDMAYYRIGEMLQNLEEMLQMESVNYHAHVRLPRAERVEIAKWLTKKTRHEDTISASRLESLLAEYKDQRSDDEERAPGVWASELAETVLAYHSEMYTIFMSGDVVPPQQLAKALKEGPL